MMGQIAEARVTRARVYLNGCVITCAGTMNLSRGDNTVLVDCVAFNAVEDSLRVRLPAGITLVSVGIANDGPKDKLDQESCVEECRRTVARIDERIKNRTTQKELWLSRAKSEQLPQGGLSDVAAYLEALPARLDTLDDELAELRRERDRANEQLIKAQKELNDLRSVPVGYMDEIEMYPLDLLEFFKAIGVSDEVVDHLRKCFEKRSPVDDFVHQRMLDALRLYLIVGGMPAVVQKYLDTNNLRKVYEEQRGIIRTYKKDITQYAAEHKLQIEEIYDLIPSELNAKNKRFILKELNEKARFNKYENSFLWLKDAGVAIPTYNVEEPRVPLLLNKQRNLFKLFLNDVGLLAAMYGGNIQTRLLSKDANINYGAVFENLVAQELYAHGFAPDHFLYFFNSKKQGELDFVLEYDNRVLPIEVKSGKDYARHNALSNVMDNPEYDIPQAYVFCNENVQVKERVAYLPIYMITFLEQQPVADHVYKFDLTGLKAENSTSDEY